MHSNFNDFKNENMNLELERFLENQTEMLGNLTITDSIDLETLTDICEEYHKRKLKLLGVAEAMAMRPQVTLLEKVTRVEVIDKNGRSYVNRKPTNEVEISLQDDGRTLKVVISDYL